MKKRRICIFTGTRAEYGLLKPLIDEFKREKDIELQLIISGMHLSPEFGLTNKEIDFDGISKVENVEILLSSDTSIGVSKAMGLGMISYAEVLERLKPDLLIGLGDRFELFTAVTSALIQKIPVAHIYGGEVTKGAYDDAFRHSITKMSHLHFTSTENYRKRIIQLGENPKTVFNVGALGIDNIKNTILLSKSELESSLSYKLDKPFFVVTYHPVTLNTNKEDNQVKNLFKALDYFVEYKLIITKPNSDNKSRAIINMINEYEYHNKGRVKSFTSLGQLRYLSSLKYSEIMIGNSSSGILEMPYFKKPTVNIGDRQEGRVFPSSVIQCNLSYKEIVSAINKGLSKAFLNKCKRTKSIYDGGKTAKAIKNILLENIDNIILKKSFYDFSLRN